MEDFGQKAKSQLKMGFDFLKGKAKDTVDITKLQSQIRSLEQRRDECLLEVGQRVYVMFDMDKFDPEDVKPRVNEVREIKARIEALQTEVKSIKQGQHEAAPPEHEHEHNEPPEP